jgi:hypothetical protein
LIVVPLEEISVLGDFDERDTWQHVWLSW